MNKLSLLLIMYLIISCKENKKEIRSSRDISNKKYSNSNNQDTIIDNISKNCEEAQERNIYDYNLCNDWKILNELQIKRILKSGELGDGVEGDSRTLHYTSSELPIWITADMIVGKQKYKLKIDGGSYFYLINSRNIESLYFCKNNKYRTSFISGIGTEDDEQYEKLKIKNWDKIRSTKTDLSLWQGNYNLDNGNFEQGYKTYHIKIENNTCIFYQGDLPACQVDCLVDIYDNKLLLYVKSDKFKKSQYDVSFIESLSEGDYLLKIIKRNNKFYIQSPTIKYWNEKSEKFERNVEIETQKVNY